MSKFLKNKTIFFLGIIFALSFLPEISLAATYYIDFQSGSDSNNGLSTSVPWKHCPGDSNAAGTAKSTTPSAGDTICFKGGVTYRGTITIQSAGTSGNQIIYDGACSGFGTGNAIITTSAAFTNEWTQCSDVATCGNNANYANIYYADISALVSAGLTVFHPWFEGDTLLYLAQDPNPVTQFHWADLTDYKSVAYTAVSKVGDTGYLTDATYFTQSSSSYWDGAYIGVWYQGNQIHRTPILSFNPSTDTVSFDMTGKTFYSAGYNTAYAMLNHLSILDRAGEYVIDTTGGKIYLWSNSAPPTNISYSMGTHYGIFNYSEHAYNTVRNFIFKNTHGFVARQQIMGAGNYYPSQNFQNNTILNNGSMGNNAVFLNNGSGGIISGNTVSYVQLGRGITSARASNMQILNNTLHHIDGTVIFVNQSMSPLVQGNILYEFKGIHGNGITVYGDPGLESTNAVVRNNTIYCGLRLITTDYCVDISFYNNVADACGADTTIVADWVGSTGTMRFVNNTFINSPSYGAIGISSAVSSIYARNNILAKEIIPKPGVAPTPDAQYNCYMYNYTGTETGKQTDTMSNTFTNYSNHDYTLKSGSNCKDRGTDMSSYLTTDILGVSRPQGSAWDIGAYEYVGAPDTTPPAAPTGVTIQ